MVVESKRQRTSDFTLPAGYTWAEFRRSRSFHVMKPDGFLLCAYATARYPHASAPGWRNWACAGCAKLIPTLEAAPVQRWAVEVQMTWIRTGRAVVSAASKSDAEKAADALDAEQLAWGAEDAALPMRYGKNVKVSRLRLLAEAPPD